MDQQLRMKHVLVIAGTDSSGGAGLTRDTAVASELGCSVKPVVTCVTAQTDAAVHMIHQVPPQVVVAQIRAAFADTPPDAVKIGMIGAGECADAIATALASCNVPIVIDSVLKSSSGATLFRGDCLEQLFPMATLLTPNLGEAAILTQRSPATSDAEIATQACLLLQQGAQAVLIKGGHGRGAECTDHLFDAAGHWRFSMPRLPKSNRGTGCSLATAIACNLASGQDLHDACHLAKNHIQQWIGGPA